MPSPNSTPAPESRSAGGLALVLAAGALAYANSLGGEFQFDDYHVIVDAPRVHAWGTWAQAAWSGGLRPLLNLSYTWSWVSGGGTPTSFHAFNLAVHFAVCCLVFLLAREFLRRVQVPAPAGADGTALWTAALFAVHPVHTEAVTYISGRSSSLMALFTLGAMLAYARQEQRGARVASLALCVAAVATKEVALAFPLALLVWDGALGVPWREMLRRQWPYWALFGAGAAFALLHPGTGRLLREAAQLGDPMHNLAAQVQVTVALLGKEILPWGLNIDPDWPRVSGLLDVLPQLFGLLTAVALAWRLRATRPWWFLAVAWALAHLLLPYIFLARLDVANERQLYLADWGLLLALVIEARLALRPRGAAAVVATITVLLAIATLLRNQDYATQVALWEDTARLSPRKARVLNNLGYAYQLAGRDEDAALAYRRALELDPESQKAWNNLQRLTGPRGVPSRPGPDRKSS